MYANRFPPRKSLTPEEQFVKGRGDLWDGLFLPPIIIKATNLLTGGPVNKKYNGPSTPVQELLQLCSFLLLSLSVAIEDLERRFSAARKQYCKVFIVDVIKMLEEDRVPKLENSWRYLSQASSLSSYEQE